MVIGLRYNQLTALGSRQSAIGNGHEPHDSDYLLPVARRRLPVIEAHAANHADTC